MRSVVARQEHDGRTIVQRLWGLLKPADSVRIDEFRFFKRHGCTQQQAYDQRKQFEAACRRRLAAGVAA
jgi:hypothetical protein